MELELAYRPTGKQLAFHASTADEVLYGGAAGGGKSYAICWDALMRCLKYPQTHAYLFRRTYPELEMTLVRTMMRIAPKELGKYVASAHELRLSNGSVIHFCHLSNEGEGLLKYQGAEIHWLYFDELTHFTKPMYDYLRTRLRAEKRLGITPCVRCASNPGGPGHAWVKARFVDATGAGQRVAEATVESSILGGVSVRRIEYIPATAMDNPHITRDYIVELEQKPKALREALLLGKWDAFDGQAFPEFVDDPAHYEDGLYTHVIKPFKIPWHWTRVVSFDHGYTRPFSFGVWAVDEEGRLYRIKELYGCTGRPNEGLRIDPVEQARRIREAEQNDPVLRGRVIQGIADPAIFDESRGESIAAMMERSPNFLHWMPGDHTRLAGKMQFHYRLAFDGEGKPMFQVFNTCKHFIRTIPNLVYDESNVEDIDTRQEDHIYDECRYVLMEKPISPPRRTVRPPQPDDPLELHQRARFYRI